MIIKNKTINLNNKPFIIAELSANHNGSLKNALKLVDQAAWCGVSAIKIQTINPDEITLNSKKKDFIIKNKKSIWYKKTFYNLYKKSSIPLIWQEKIFRKAKKMGLICFSSPFDEKSVDFLEKIKTPCYKIASFENQHFPLLKKVASTGKPIIMSLGSLSLDETYESYSYLKRNGAKNIALLKCTSVYPAKEIDLNLQTMQDLRNKFKCEIGFSDHTDHIFSSVTAVSLGATIIEKHFKLDDNNKTLDSKFSIEKNQMRQLVLGCNIAQASRGRIKYSLSKDEKIAKKFKRSIYISKKIRKNEIFTPENIKIVRPGYGMLPKFYNNILGKKASRNLDFGERLLKKYIKNFKN